MSITPEIGLVIILIVGAFVYWLHTAKGKAEAAALQSDLKTEIAKVEANVKAHVTATAASTPTVASPQPAAAPPVQAAQPQAPKQNVTEALLGSPAGSTVQLATPATNQPGFSPSPPGAA